MWNPELSTTKVHDLFYPTPASLEEIASINVALQIWRKEINAYRINNTLKDLEYEEKISLRDVASYVPSIILSSIEKHVKILGSSIKDWLDYHYSAVFRYYRDQIMVLGPSCILHHFDDFICDFDAAIDYVKTAKRMIHHGRFSNNEKFQIAMTYCFEDDILHIRPSVCMRFDMDNYYYHSFPQCFYWVCRLKNYRLPNCDDYAVIFRSLVESAWCRARNWSAMLFFWNRITSNTGFRSPLSDSGFRSRLSDSGFRSRLSVLSEFFRYSLMDFREQELDAFVVALRYDYHSNDIISLVARTWILIRHKINENDFDHLVYAIVTSQCRGEPQDDADNSSRLWNVIWHHAPENFKQSAIRNVLLQYKLLSRDEMIDDYYSPQIEYFGCYKKVSFVLSMLSDSSLEDRRAFWNSNWTDLIDRVRTNDLRRLMALCFGNEEAQIDNFKKNVLSLYETIKPSCELLLKFAHITELVHFLNFCCPEASTARNIRLNLLNGNFLSLDLIKNSRLLSQFISDTYNNIELVEEFKNRLLTSTSTVEMLQWNSVFGEIPSVMEFVDTFETSEKAAVHHTKHSIMSYVRKNLIKGRILGIERDGLHAFVTWCFGNDIDEIAEFRRKLPIDEIIQAVVKKEARNEHFFNLWCTADSDDYDYSALLDYEFDPLIECSSHSRAPVTYHPHLVKFLQWYFVTSEAYEEFKAQYADNDVLVTLLTAEN